MSEKISQNPESNVYQEKLASVTDRRLTPENIETYAHDALSDLVEMVDELVVSYNRHPTILANNTQANERSSFVYFGLDADMVERSLDHIADMAERIDALDAVIDRATEKATFVIVPATDRPGVHRETGDTPFEKQKIIPRLKTLAFILENRFDIDLEDRSQFLVTPGVITDEMMNIRSYNMVEMPTLDRLMLVCDAESNVTFIFDTVQLSSEEIDHQLLAKMDKNELEELIKTHNGLGKKLSYSKQYVEHIISLLKEIPLEDELTVIDKDSSQFLKSVPELPQGFLTANGMAAEWDLSDRTVWLAIKAIIDTLAPIEVRVYSTSGKTYSNSTKVHSVLGMGYGPADQQKLHDYLEQKGSLTRRARPDELTRFGMSKAFGIPRDVINTAVAELGDMLGETELAKFSRVAEAFQPEQQQMVREWIAKNYILDKKGALVRSTDERLKDLTGMSEFDLANKLGTTRHVIRKIRLELDTELGTNYVTDDSRNASIPERMQRLIEEKFDIYKQSETYKLEPAPQGYESVMGITRRLGCHYNTTKRAILATKDQLGKVIEALFSNNPSPAYSPEQQVIIENWLITNTKRQRNSKFGRSALDKSL